MPVQKLLTVKLGSSRVYTLGWWTKGEGPANLSTRSGSTKLSTNSPGSRRWAIVTGSISPASDTKW